MLLPFLAWTVTGIFFFFKPGYQAAYQPISVKLYPLKHVIPLPEHHQWLEVRQLQTVLGPHLLVRDDSGWHQLDSKTLKPRPALSDAELLLLIEQAIADDKARYGEIVSINKQVAETSTGVRISVNWPQMTMRQQGKDTDLINNIYDIHYLRWTGYKQLDQYLGVLGLLLVALLAILGTWMTVKRAKITN